MKKIGPILKRVLYQKDIPHPVAWLAEELGVSKSYVYKMMNSYTLDTDLIKLLSVTLGYNFMTDLKYEEEESLKRLKNERG